MDCGVVLDLGKKPDVHSQTDEMDREGVPSLWGTLRVLNRCPHAHLAF